MPAPDFLDTNILVYAYDSTSLKKQRVAQQLLLSAALGEFLISTQVLAEFSVTLLHKLSPPVPGGHVLEILDRLAAIQTIATDADTVRQAIRVRAEYGIHFYDAMIVATAERAGCSRILSEDLNSGQAYFGVRIENPFL